MKTARITTAWIGDGKSRETLFRPACADGHALASWSDTTGADPTKGGEYLILVQCDALVLSQVKDDTKYKGKVTELTADTADVAVVATPK